MGSYYWNVGSGGWGTIANWTGGSFPNDPSAEAYIQESGAYTVTIEPDASYSVDYLNLSAGQATLSVVGTLTLTGTDATLDEYSGTIMLSGMIAGGTVNLAGGAYFIDEGGSLTGALNATYNADLDVNGYTLTLSGNGSVRSGVYGGGTLDIAGIYDVGGLYLASGTEELVTGTAIQDDHNRLDYDNGAAPSVLSIASTGTYDVTVVDSDLDDYGPLGTIINSGLFENVVSLASYTYNEQYFSFFSYFNFYQNFTNSSTGTIYIGASDDISLLQGTSDLAGTITGPGNIAFGQGDTATLEAGLVLNTGGMQITDSNTDVILESNRTFSAATFVLQNGASLSLNGYTADLSGGGALAAYIVGPGTLDVSGTYTVGGLYLSSGVTEILTGLEIQTGETRFDYDGGSVSTVLSIASSGIYDITTDSIQDDYYNYDNYGTIINAGLFEKTGLDGNSAINASFTNASSGTIFIDAGNELQLVNANTNILAGTIGGPGTLDLGNSGTFKLQAGLSLSVGELIVDSSSRAILESNRTFSSADFVLQNNASLALNGHTAYLNGSGDLAAYVSGPGTLRVGGTFYTAADLLSGVTEIITGVEVQNGTSYLDIDSGSAATVLSIATGGVYDIVADNPILNGPNNGAGAATIINAGLFEKTGFAGGTDIYAPLTNTSTGTIDIEGSNAIRLLYDTNDLAGTVTGAGELDIYGGTTTLEAGLALSVGEFAVDYGATIILQSNLTYSGNFVQVGGDTLDLNGYNLTLTGGDPSLGYNGYLNGPGTLVVTGDANIGGYYLTNGAVLDDDGTITQSSFVQLGVYAGDTATLNIAAGAVYEIIYNNQIYVDGYSSGIEATINNAGLFEKSGDNGNSSIYAVFNNAAGATLAAVNGALYLDEGGTLAGTLTGGGGIYIGGGNATLTADAVVNAASFGINGGTLNLENSRTLSAAFSQGGGGTLDLDGFTLTLNGNPYLGNGYLSGPGTLVVTGTADINNYFLTNGAVLDDTGTITQDGVFNIGDYSGDTATLNIAAGAVYDILNDNDIYLDDYNSGTSGTINNAGLFEKTADYGNSVIYPVFNNLAGATLAAAFGNLYLDGGGTLAGTLTGADALYLQAGLFTLAAGAVVNVAALNVDGGALDLEASRNLTDSFSETSGTVDLDGFNLTLAKQIPVG